MAVTVTGAGGGAVVVTITVCLTVLVTGAAETVTALAVCAGEPQPAATPPKMTAAAISPMTRIDLRMTLIPFGGGLSVDNGFEDDVGGAVPSSAPFPLST